MCIWINAYTAAAAAAQPPLLASLAWLAFVFWFFPSQQERWISNTVSAERMHGWLNLTVNTCTVMTCIYFYLFFNIYTMLQLRREVAPLLLLFSRLEEHLVKATEMIFSSLAASSFTHPVCMSIDLLLGRKHTNAFLHATRVKIAALLYLLHYVFFQSC